MSKVQERTESDLESEWEEECESDPTWDPLEGIRPRVKEEPEEEEADPEWAEGQEGSSPPLSSVSAHAAVKEEVGEDGGADSEYEQVLEETECKRCHKIWPSLDVLYRHVSRIKPCRVTYGSKGVAGIRRRAGMKRATHKYEAKKREANLVFNGALGPKGILQWCSGQQLEDGTCDASADDEGEGEVSGCTKLDLDEQEVKVECLPEGYSLIMRPPRANDVRCARGFVGLAVGRDKEFVEARPLMAGEEVSLEGLRELLHAVSSVAGGGTLDKLVSHPDSSVGLFENAIKEKYARGRFCAEITRNDNRLPEAPPLVCRAGRSREKTFLSWGSKTGHPPIVVPSEQLVVNFDLSHRDMGAIAIDCEVRGEYYLVPLFSVNTDAFRSDDTDRSVLAFFSILSGWTGEEETLRKMWAATPCGRQAEADATHQIKLECHSLCQAPRETLVCPTCGKIFDLNTSVATEKEKFVRHVSTHRTNCHVCGLECGTLQEKRNHTKTHWKENYPCKQCKFVAGSQTSLDRHVEFNHVAIICELCGKEYTSQRTLWNHLHFVHKETLDHSLVCSVCGKAGFKHQHYLNVHEKAHRRREEARKKRKAGGRTAGFACPLKHKPGTHCKEYFAKARHVRNHIRKHMHEDEAFAGKGMPDNLRTKIPRSSRGNNPIQTLEAIKKRRKGDRLAMAAAAAAAGTGFPPGGGGGGGKSGYS